MEPTGKWTHGTPPNHHTDTRTNRPRYLTERHSMAEELPAGIEGFRNCPLEVADENSLGSGGPRSFPYRGRVRTLYGNVVTHIEAPHPEHHLLTHVGAMFANS